MAFFRGPQIVRDGLILYLDAANPKSYPGSGTIWKDLSGNKNDLHYLNDQGNIIFDESLKTMRKVSLTHTDKYRALNKVNLSNDFSLCTLVKVTESYPSANGIITNHHITSNTGAAIGVRRNSASDIRITCSTGTGTSRTYNSYYGTTNIKDKWVYAVLRFIKSTNNLSLWVNGIKEVDITYSMMTMENYIELFNWSVERNESTYNNLCDISHASVYQKGLLDQEIIQNFNATKSRFGL